MLSRRQFLKRTSIIAAGVAATALGLRLLTPGRRSITSQEWDDEFVDDGTHWTVAGSNRVSFNDAVPGAVFMESGMAIHRADIPAFPFIVTAFAQSVRFDDINSVFGASMLAVGGSADAATTGPAFYAIQWDVAYLGEIGIIDGTYDDYASQVHQNTYIKLSDGLTHEVPHYLRLAVESEASISSYWSEDGTNWETFFTDYDPGLGVPIDSVLLCSFGCEVAWDWIRFT